MNEVPVLNLLELFSQLKNSNIKVLFGLKTHIRDNINANLFLKRRHLYFYI